ncbi:pleckstrin homology domain-containing family J member 1-like [Sitophilus oryzae]|uniref:Pleckstrin homology domain-containing family J member 1 n=1 Tax=Sitophilus oryzae TaxID=7048 RepID=A0A6J2XC09_SITOR|nr:pleckstrin homology domain-containing family J member 1-like [Sitophilus oryzae]
MRYNDKELVTVSESKPDLEGVLHHMKPQGNEWSDWYQQPSFKERYFKLIANLLYYYRTNNEVEPLGVLVLENAQIAYERPHKGIPFAFSITFKVNDKFKDTEAKHIFSCRCDRDVSKWVSALKTASYEYWRSQYLILKTKIDMKAGNDPVLEYLKDNNVSTTSTMKVEIKKKKTKSTKSTFYSHIETNTLFQNSTTHCASREVVSTSNETNNLAIDNLITF